MFVRIGGDEDDLALFGRDEEETGIFQEQNLTFAVTAAFPFSLAGLQIDAGENAAVIAVGAPLVSDEVGEIRFEMARGPKFFGRVLAVVLFDANRARAHVHAGG